MMSETVVKRLSYVPSPATMKPCAVDGELCQPFPERDSAICSWHWMLAHWDAMARRQERTLCADSAPLAARKNAESRIEVVFEQLTADEDLALLYRLLRRRGWSDDRSDTVLHKARW